MSYSNLDIILKVNSLHSKYKNLQNLYYDMYLLSFTDTDDIMYKKHLYLYRKFKETSRLLNQLKSLLNKTSQQKFGASEIKVLLEYSDIKKIIDQYRLYPIIENSHEDLEVL